jgi:hypothetical protein
MSTGSIANMRLQHGIVENKNAAIKKALLKGPS